MLFYEKKTKDGYEYEAEEFVGKFIFKSADRIEPKILDRCVVVLSQTSGGKGELKNYGQVIEYEFTPTPLWEEEDEELKES